MSLKNRVRISSTLPTLLADKLKEYSDDTMIPITKIIEKAVDGFLDKKNTQ
ncbi:MAG: ribbon-helix-helix domain-containing protein [Fusobacteria bacterium]|nr:ribbon-helix-helix domain-containing protein [Fusobacteriota bacterium]